MKCKYAPRYRVTIRAQGSRTLYGIAGRRYDPFTDRVIYRDLEDVADSLRDVREVVRLLNLWCVGLEWMGEAVEELLR